ncbi:MAG: hypothetical protein KKD28_08870 [Chloroflexi bacterium]|nr:hypothetical protein [Chloroflexota bacterium]MBU1661570.1 hypothetical protein [Chloroflexota bacterium]
MPRTQINCPNCRQPIVADVQQLFDVGANPQARQMLLTGAFNIAQCPHCGYQGNLSVPIVYHDPAKELLLTFFPPEMMLPREKQERIIGPMLIRVMNSLPQEQRKGYLLNPQTMLTMQGLIERILEADGITKEMIQAQEQRMNLLQRLLAASDDSLPEIIKQEDEMIDGDFFTLFSRFMESAMMERDEKAARQLGGLQTALLENSSVGRELREEAQEIEAAVQSLQELKEELTREKLLELVIEAPTDTRLRALTRLTRPGMDYAFFQMLTERIDRTRAQDRARLIEIREKLLGYTQAVDQEMKARLELAHKNLEAILQVDDIEVVVRQNLGAIDEFFVQAADEDLEAARETSDLERSAKIQRIISVIEEASAPPPEFDLIEELLEIADDETALQQALDGRADEVTPELLQMLSGVVTQVQASMERLEGEDKAKQQEILDRLQAVHNAALLISMKRSFAAG